MKRFLTSENWKKKTPTMLSYWFEYYHVTSEKLLNLSFYKAWINYVPPTPHTAGQIKLEKNTK